MTSNPRHNPDGIDLGIPHRSAPPNNQALLGAGRAIIASVVVLGTALIAAAVFVNTVSTRFSGGDTGGTSVTSSQSLQLQSALVEQRRAAVLDSASQLADFRAAIADPARSSGINLDASEAARRDFELTALVLECIDAVDGYNLAAQARTAAELQSAGVPAGYAWSVDCASGQQPSQVENR